MLHRIEANDKIACLRSLERDDDKAREILTGKSSPSSATDVANTTEGSVRWSQSQVVCSLTYIDFPFSEHLDNIPLDSDRHSFDGSSRVICGSVSQ